MSTTLQTAKAINAPQVGESEFTPSQTNPSPKAVPRGTTCGTIWSLCDLKDIRENVRESVSSAAFVPTEAKAMLIEGIDGIFPSARLLSLNAYLHVVEQKGKKTAVWSITIGEL